MLGTVERLFEPVLSPLALLDGRARKSVFAALIFGEDQWVQRHVHVEVELVDVELDLARDGHRHGASGRIEVGYVDDARWFAGGLDPFDQVPGSDLAQLPDADHRVHPAPLAQRDQPIVLR